MNSLYDYLRDANANGIPHADAVQLLLWIFCTKDFLPPEIRRLELSKEVLIDTFRRLSTDGFVTDLNVRQALPSWEELVREFLLGNCARDENFLSRAGQYLQIRN
jgi:hypothetical protein